MRAGTLSKLLSIEKRVEVQDDYGEAKPTWTEVAKVYGSIYPVRGTERYMSMEKHATATHEINIRFTKTISAKHRIVYDGREFDILSVLNVAERNKQMKIIAKESV